jgi:hypothetical protein
MRFKDAKAKISRLERQNFLLQKRINDSVKNISKEKTYDFNLLEIIVRPRRELLFPYDVCTVDLQVIGAPEIQVPTIRSTKKITQASIHFVKEHREEFIRKIGEILAREILEIAY